MSQQNEQKTWAIVTVLNDNVSDVELQGIIPEVEKVVDQWNAKGKFLWTGPFEDNKTSLTIFSGTDKEAREFYDQHKKATGDLVTTYVNEWDAFPLLGLL